MEDDGPIYHVQLPPQSFEDTGFVTHGFANGDLISAKVVPSRDEGGFSIEVTVKFENGESVFVMDRFAALCLVDVLTKNLLNQEELLYLKQEKEKQ